MAPGTFLGEFELVVLLAVMQLGDDAHAINLRDHIERRAERKVTRGALYATLERLERKGFLEWELDETTPGRGGMPRRRFFVTPEGIQAVRTSQTMIARLSEGLEEALG
jgi:DNA-binding PadR family transcriptional regulator